MTYSNVTCTHIPQLSWSDCQQKLMLSGNEVHVWRADYSAYPSFSAGQAAALLDATEIEKAKRYYHEADRHKFMARKVSLRILLGKYLNQRSSDVRFTLDENKKPVLCGVDQNVHFNVAHAGDCFLIAIAHTPVGVDVEYVNTRFNYADIIAGQFSEDEQNHVLNDKMPVTQFYKLWTRKEALVKATAKGITDDFKFTPSLPGRHTVSTELTGATGNWKTVSFDVSDNYTGSISCQENYGPLFFNLPVNIY